VVFGLPVLFFQHDMLWFLLALISVPVIETFDE